MYPDIELVPQPFGMGDNGPTDCATWTGLNHGDFKQLHSNR